MVLLGVEFMLSLVEEDHFFAKMVFCENGAIFFRANQQHCDQKAEGISYEDNYKVASIVASLMEQPRLSFMKGWQVTYQGRPLSV